MERKLKKKVIGNTEERERERNTNKRDKQIKRKVRWSKGRKREKHK
jgi:hypothetical protein